MRISDWSSDVCSSDLTNRIIGDPHIDQTVVNYNAGYEFGDYEIYSFGSYGHKKAAAYENTRPPTTVVSASGVPYYAGGFQPQERIDETDYSVTGGFRSEEHTSELQSLMRISYAVFCLKKN